MRDGNVSSTPGTPSPNLLGPPTASHGVTRNCGRLTRPLRRSPGRRRARDLGAVDQELPGMAHPGPGSRLGGHAQDPGSSRERAVQRPLWGDVDRTGREPGGGDQAEVTPAPHPGTTTGSDPGESMATQPDPEHRASRPEHRKHSRHSAQRTARFPEGRGGGRAHRTGVVTSRTAAQLCVRAVRLRRPDRGHLAPGRPLQHGGHRNGLPAPDQARDHARSCGDGQDLREPVTRTQFPRSHTGCFCRWAVLGSNQ